MKKPTQKMSTLVVSALKNLRDPRGSSNKDILKYIMSEYNNSEPRIRRKLYTFLKRGLENGVILRNRTGYTLNTREIMDAGTKLNCSKKKKKKKKKRSKKLSCKSSKKRSKKRRKKKKKKVKRAACPRKGKKSKPKRDACPRCHPIGITSEKTNESQENVEMASEHDSRASSRHAHVDEARLARNSRSRSRSKFTLDRISNRSRSASRTSASNHKINDE